MAITVMAGCVSKSMHPIALIFLSIHLDQMTVGTWHLWADQLLKKKRSERLGESLYFTPD